MKIPWKWIILGVGVFIVLLSVAYGGTGYKVMRDWIIADQAIIQQELESEVAKLDVEREGYLKQILQLKQERVKLNNEYQKLKDKYAGLENQMAGIYVPVNPDDLVLAFRKRGFKSTTLLRSR